jgi:predicted peptidase
MWWALTAPEPSTVRRVVALAPVADLARAYTDGLGDGAVAALLGGSPDRHPDRYAATDPARILRDRARDRAGVADDPPITVLHGADDDRVPAAHSRDLPVHRVAGRRRGTADDTLRRPARCRPELTPCRAPGTA